MKDSDEATDGRVQFAKPNQLVTVSERKLKANRENAKKSTGPKTPRGKAFTRRNALNHGLFAKHLFANCMPRGEDPDEFRELIEQFRQEYQPVGIAEELEVERIAVCWLRHHRAWRYENAELLFAQNDLVLQEQEIREQRVMIAGLESLFPLLETAEREIVATGRISQEVQEKMFAILRFGESWRDLEEIVKRAVKNKQEEIAIRDSNDPRILSSVSLQEVRKLLPHLSGSQAELSGVIALATAKLAMKFIELENASYFESAFRMQYDRHAISNTDAMDKVLRYETAIDRSLSRAVDRLERLQRRRRGEPVLPPVNVHLTQ